eukprot:18572-Heterococcus_DN1.PRE.2
MILCTHCEQLLLFIAQNANGPRTEPDFDCDTHRREEREGKVAGFYSPSLTADLNCSHKNSFY